MPDAVVPLHTQSLVLWNSKFLMITFPPQIVPALTSQPRLEKKHATGTAYAFAHSATPSRIEGASTPSFLIMWLFAFICYSLRICAQCFVFKGFNIFVVSSGLL
jgi:hypothetical protein